MAVDVRGLMMEPIYDEKLDRVLAPLSSRIFVPAGRAFLEPGDHLNCIYYIKSGITKHYMSNLDGGEKLLYSLSAGWLFGEAPLITSAPTGLTSVAETDVVLYQIPEKICHRLTDENKLFRDALLKSYAYKTLTMRYEIENLAFHSCKNRLMRLLSSAVDTETIADVGWYNLKRRYKQQELCVIVGAARITVTKLMHELKEEGFLRIVNRNIQLNGEKRDAFMEKCHNIDGLV